MTQKPLHRYLDAALLRPEMTRTEFLDGLNTCLAVRPRTVCVRPCDIEAAVSQCRGTETAVSCVLGFPHGSVPTAIKAAEASLYGSWGVSEIDMVANIGWIRSALWELVEADIRAVVDAVRSLGVRVKVILETCYLLESEMRAAVEASVSAGADFVKTSTGFAPAGATEAAVTLLHSAAQGRIRVKASGGIRTRQDAQRFVDLGCHRLGVHYTTCVAICTETAAADDQSDVY